MDRGTWRATVYGVTKGLDTKTKPPQQQNGWSSLTLLWIQLGSSLTSGKHKTLCGVLPSCLLLKCELHAPLSSQLSHLSIRQWDHIQVRTRHVKPDYKINSFYLVWHLNSGAVWATYFQFFPKLINLQFIKLSLKIRILNGVSFWV